MSVNTKVNGQLVKSAGLYSVTAPVGMADIYSTEEKEVGLWVNNKPLYQKSYYVDSLPSQAGTKVIATGLTGIEMCKLGECWSNGFGEINIVRCESASANTYGMGCWVAVTNGVPSITIEVGRNRSSIDAWITIQYTKTADTPWSGKFVPQGYGYVSSGDIYSLEERQVGVWSDGKPLYQINLTWTGSISLRTDAYTTIPFTNIPQNIDFVVAKEVITDQLYDTRVRFYYNNGDIQAVTNQTGGQTVTSIILPILYTKTTDVAGSGEYVPSGDKAVHYSTEEEVIGTFLGETLYRKVFNFSTPLGITYNSITETSIDATNIASIINAIGIHADGTCYGTLLADPTRSNHTILGLQTNRNGANATIEKLILEYTKTS